MNKCIFTDFNKIVKTFCGTEALKYSVLMHLKACLDGVFKLCYYFLGPTMFLWKMSLALLIRFVTSNSSGPMVRRYKLLISGKRLHSTWPEQNRNGTLNCVT